jgi:hypothetical protein
MSLSSQRDWVGSFILPVRDALLSGEEATVLERLAKRLNQMKVILYGDGEKDVCKDKSLVGNLSIGAGPAGYTCIFDL